MWGLSQYTSGDLAFNGFLWCLSEGRAQASRTVLKILYRFFYVYLVTRRVNGLTKGSTRALSWLDSGEDEDSSEVRSLQDCARPWIKVILIVE